MKAEDIIEGLNRSIEDKRNEFNIKSSGHLILQKTIKSHQTFKAYKEYEYIIWFVKNSKKYKIMTVKETAKVLEGQEELIIRKMNIELSRLIFNWVGSNFYQQIIKGEYDEFITE